MQTLICHSTVEFIERPFLRSLQLSSGVITEITEARVTVAVRCSGKEAVGRGTIYLSDLWAWPDPAFDHNENDRILRDICRQIASTLPGLCGSGSAHPLKLGLRLHESVCHGEPFGSIPILALAMCASPFDAALHDAAGLALDLSAFDFYGEVFPIESADRYFAKGGATQAIQHLMKPPRKRLDAWLIVNKMDSLEGDVLPWIENRGYRCFKLKIAGKNNIEDVARTVEVYRFAKANGVALPHLTVDSNEGNPHADSVLDYLERLRAADENAFRAVDYLEQPTGRDITRDRFDWRPVTKLKPILLDEGLTHLNLLEEAKRQGWSGLALKTCKGHSFTLTAAAWAHQNGMIFSIQDLINPGLSLIHAALLAAHIHPVNGVELNSPQFTPQANAEWVPRWNYLFEPGNGSHRIPDKIPPGLGSCL